ncbi:MAG: hypothetical protein EOO11_10275 [Chitinophagaceae bacterium]|nr:MAG: hypothetical protein EOO11_10275 [Chitinophagaceae bacterium]
MALEHDAPEEPLVGPNPFAGRLTLRLPAPAAGTVLLRFMAADGRAWSYRVPAQGRIVPVEATGLPAGHYVLQAWSGEGRLLLTTALVKAAR